MMSYLRAHHTHFSVPPVHRVVKQRLFISFPFVFRPLTKENGRSPQYMPAELESISLSRCRFSANKTLVPGHSVKLRIKLFEILRLDADMPICTAADAFDLVATAQLLSRKSLLSGGYQYEAQFTAFFQGDLASLQRVIEKCAQAAH